MPHADFSSPDRATPFRASVLLATGLHAAALLCWRVSPPSPGTVEVAHGPVEVSLVQEAPSQDVQPSGPAPPSAPELPKTELSNTDRPMPQEPVNEAPKAPEMVATEPRLSPIPTIPFPPTPAPLPAEPADKPEQFPQPQPPPAPQTTKPTLSKTPDVPPRADAPAAKPSTPANNPKAATGGITASTKASTQTSTTTTNGPITLVKPVYSVQPTVRYPSESRAANEQGTVILRITINADGRPVNVTVAKSSGFNRLDRAAVEGGWRCRVQNAQAGAQFEAPLRFSLAQ